MAGVKLSPDLRSANEAAEEVLWVQCEDIQNKSSKLGGGSGHSNGEADGDPGRDEGNDDSRVASSTSHRGPNRGFQIRTRWPKYTFGDFGSSSDFYFPLF